MRITILYIYILIKQQTRIDIYNNSVFHLHCSCSSVNKWKMTTTTKKITEKRKSSKRARTCSPSCHGFLWLWDLNKTWVTVSYARPALGGYMPPAPPNLKFTLPSRQFNNSLITNIQIIVLFFLVFWFLFWYAENVSLMLESCKYEKAWFIQTRPAWCALFTTADFEVSTHLYMYIYVLYICT